MLLFKIGAPEGIRTPTLLAAEPKSAAYTNFATGAYSILKQAANRKSFPELISPKSTESTNSAMPAYECHHFITGRKPCQLRRGRACGLRSFS